MIDVNSKWSDLVQRGFFSEYTYEAKRRYLKSSRALTNDLATNSVIAEVGCGTGRYHRVLRELGYTNLISVDLTIEHIKKAKEMNPEGIFVVASGENLPFKSATFDALVSNAAIEHFGDPRAGLREFARITTEGARIVVTSDCFSWRIFQMLGLYKSKMPIDKTLTYWGFKRNFESAGLKINAADAWGITQYLRPLVRRIGSLKSTMAKAMGDDHWSNVTPSKMATLLLRMFFLDENLFVLLKHKDNVTLSPVTNNSEPRALLRLEDVLASPCCRVDLVPDEGRLVCKLCNFAYPVVDGVPMFV